jgi:dTDP-4-dehydrorhamnose 3,5-epimerase
MKVSNTALVGLKLIEPQVFGDARGYFFEVWSSERYAAEVGATGFVQDNLSRSERGVLRGLHLQHPHGQGKLVWVVVGAVYDAAADIRRGSPTFGKWVGYELSEANHRQLYVPPGFAHGFCVLSEVAVFCYKCTDTYHPEAEMGVLYSDPGLGIDWPVKDPKLSDRDRGWPRLSDIPPERLPGYG